MAKHGKKYKAAREKVVAGKAYAPKEALLLVKETSTANFDATVEVHLKMGLDPRQAEQQVRDVVVLPNGLGKTVKVLVFAQGEGAQFAEKGGADYVADTDEWLKKIQDGFTDFDVAIATPDMMGKAGRLGRVLGPRGLMPNPKAGTVVAPEHLERTIMEAKAGRVEFRLDKTANIHVPIGKVSFTDEKLEENFAYLMDAIKKAKPPTAKGSYIRKIVLASTMGPGVKVDNSLALSMEIA
ncbi:MAG: 50S ribosomal protein L1 [Anaerolineaceae bacterium]|nr:50S ribosomal protein L1 [Anaerolineaceae bacterium]